jgi:hypothetical protein
MWWRIQRRYVIGFFSDFCPAGKNLKEGTMLLRKCGCLRIVAPSGTLRGVRQAVLRAYRRMR